MSNNLFVLAHIELPNNKEQVDKINEIHYQMIKHNHGYIVTL